MIVNNMKSFSQFTHGVRSSRMPLLNTYASASSRVSSRGYSSFNAGASKVASIASKRNALAAALTAIGGGVLGYAIGNRETLNETETSPILDPASPETFNVRLKGSRGVVNYVHPYPSDEVAKKLLHEHATSRAFEPMTSNGVVRFDNNWVGCNEPCEDRHVENYLSRDILFTTSPRDGLNNADTVLFDHPEASSLKLFSMIDGHGGGATADVLARDLHPRVVKSLQSLYGGTKPSTLDPMQVMRQLQRGDYRSFLKQYFAMGGASKALSTEMAPSLSITPDVLSAAIASAYMELDYDICTGPLRLIAKGNASAKNKDDVKAISEPATNGACALTVLVDEERQEVYVANTGDSRAVAGYYMPPQTDSQGILHEGGWRCEVLTEDHTAKGPRELKRLRGEHPGEEDHIIGEQNRVLGDLMPSRAFGDAQWHKWTKEETEAIRKLKWKSGRGKPPAFDALKHKSVPYIIARPDVTFKSLKGSKRTGQLKFIILATDGLWDNITSEEAVGLVSTHLAHPEHAPLKREKVQDTLISQNKDSADKYPGGRAKGEELTGSWVYKDKNAATHLIRNAFEVCESLPDAGNKVICLKPPIGRWIRDDVTCSVVFFGDKTGEIIPPSQNKKNKAKA